MTRKDFELIAGVINKAFHDGELSFITAHELAARFANELRETNPHFDAVRFVNTAVK